MVYTGMTAKPWEVFADWSIEDLRELVKQGREARALREAQVIEAESHPVGLLESPADASAEAT